jgi:hypothetical protein
MIKYKDIKNSRTLSEFSEFEPLSKALMKIQKTNSCDNSIIEIETRISDFF